MKNGVELALGGRPPYTLTMTEPPDIEDLASRFLDLWRQHLTAIASDPTNADAMQRVFAAFNPGDNAPFDPASRPGFNTDWLQEGARAKDTTEDPSTHAFAGPANAPGSAPTTGASGGGGDVVRNLERRLAELEARLDGLESPEEPSGESKTKS